MTEQAVYITGLAALASTGHSPEAIWQALLAGETGIGPISNWDLSSWPRPLGAELKNFKPGEALPDRKLLKLISKQDVLGLYVANQAVQHSDLLPFRDSLENAEAFNEKSGIFVGSPGNKYYQQYDFLPLIAKTEGDMPAFAEQLFEQVHPMWLLRILPNNVLAYAGIQYQFKGANHNITNHAVAGSQALIEAFHAIQSGQADRVLVIAYDIGTEPQALYYYDALGLIASEGLKPFEASQDGTILADGAAAVLLESAASAKARNAKCYARFLAGKTATEAEGLFSIEVEGDKLAALIADSLAMAGIGPEDLGMVVAHGNGNPKSDSSEALAIEKALGAAAPPCTAFKWSTGHTITASGLLDTVLATKALKAGTVPGIANFQQPAATAERLSLAAVARPLAQDKKRALIINRGFASMNSCLLLEACD